MKVMKMKKINIISVLLATAFCMGVVNNDAFKVYADVPEEAPIIFSESDYEIGESENKQQIENSAKAGNENLALTEGFTYFGTQGYSSTQAEKAFDGQYDTVWQAGSSYGKAPGKNVGVDAGEGNTIVFNKAVVYENASKGEYRVTEFELQVSDDMTSWRKVAGGETIGENPVVLEFGTVSARAVRFYIVRTIGDYKMPLIAEMELYREVSSSTDISSEVYKIDSEKKEIEIFEGDKVSDLVEAIAVPYGGSIQFYDENGVLENNAPLTEKCTAVVTAEDGISTQSYTIRFYTIEPGTNLANVAGVSPIGDAGYSSTGPEKAFDSNYGTSWQTIATPGAGRKIGLDAGAGKIMTFNTVKLYESSDGNGIFRTTGFEIQITNDDPGTNAGSGSWTTVASGEKIGKEGVELKFKTQNARAVRFYVTSTNPTEKVPLISEMVVSWELSSDTHITSEKYYIEADGRVIYVPYGTTANEINQNIILPIEATASVTNASGGAVSGSVDGGCLLTVTAQDGVSTAVYTIYPDSEMIAKIKENTTADAFFAGLIAANGKVYNINEEEYMLLDEVRKEKLADNLFSRRNEIVTGEDMETLFEKLLLVEKINSSDADGITELLEKSGEALGLPSGNYTAYDIFLNRYDCTQIIAKMLDDVEFESETEIIELLTEKACLYAISKTSNWGEVHSIFTAGGNLGDYDLSEYLDIDDTSDIDSAFVGKDFDTLGELIADLDEMVSEYEPPSSGSGSSGGGGFSGGGSSGGGSSKPSSVVVFENNSSVPAADSKKSFVDLSSAEWAAQSIEKLAEKGIISGKSDDRFYPLDNIKREEFVKIIVEAFEIEEASQEKEFSDVNANDWFFGYVNRAYQKGIISGKTENVFGTGEFITRQDMVTIIARAAEKLGYDIKSVLDGRFSDEDEISEYAVDYVNRLYTAGIIKGVDENRFNPMGTATRAEAARIVYAMLEALGKI